jgi:hypothetical protein
MDEASSMPGRALAERRLADQRQWLDGQTPLALVANPVGDTLISERLALAGAGFHF